MGGGGRPELPPGATCVPPALRQSLVGRRRADPQFTVTPTPRHPHGDARARVQTALMASVGKTCHHGSHCDERFVPRAVSASREEVTFLGGHEASRQIVNLSVMSAVTRGCSQGPSDSQPSPCETHVTHDAGLRAGCTRGGDTLCRVGERPGDGRPRERVRTGKALPWTEC